MTDRNMELVPGSTRDALAMTSQQLVKFYLLADARYSKERRPQRFTGNGGNRKAAEMSWRAFR